MSNNNTAIIDNNDIIIADMELFDSGMNLLFDVHKQLTELEGGSTDDKAKSSKISIAIEKIFSPNVKASFTRVMRGIVRTGAGVSASAVTLGAGGDIVVNSVFAVSSSMSFIKNIKSLIESFIEAKELFNQLFLLNFNYTVPIISKISVDDGLDNFLKKFNIIMIAHLKKYGTKTLERAYNAIIKIIGRITTTVSDWLGCIFPDTVGIASEIAKTLLDYVTNNSYNLIYNVLSLLSDNMQKMITNTYALKKLIRDSVVYLRDLINHMSSQQITEIIQSLGVKLSDLTTNSMLKGAINLGASTFSSIVNIGMKSYNASSSVSLASRLNLLPKAKAILVYIIDKFIIPNIDDGVNLFYQLFPMYLMFTLFITNYPSLKNEISDEYIKKQTFVVEYV